jgi:cytochrome oxidase assembly protein ShyY1
MAAPPLELSADGLDSATAEAHRRVAAEGKYLHSRSVFVGPRPVPVPPSEPAAQRRMRGVLSAPGSAAKRGYLLVTPLEVGGAEGEEGGAGWLGGGWKRARRRVVGGGDEGEDGADASRRVVLVNRGWVPPEWRELWPLAFGGDRQEEEGELVIQGAASSSSSSSGEEQAAAKAVAAAALRQAQPLGRVRVTGVAQPDETPSAFVPRNGGPGALDARHFFSVVAEEIAEACGVWSSSSAAQGGGGGTLAPPPPPPPPPLIQVCYDDSPGGGGVLDPEGRGEKPTTRALPAEIEAAERRAGGTALPGEAAAEHERRIARAASARGGAGEAVSVFPLPKPTSGLVRFSIMPEDHAGYAAMWGMMSAAMAYLALGRRGGRRSRGAVVRPPPV